MKTTEFPRYIFWSYSKDADLPEQIVAEQVILYGDLDDLFRLSTLIPKETITAVNQKIQATGRWEKRTHFINKIILGL